HVSFELCPERWVGETIRTLDEAPILLDQMPHALDDGKPRHFCCSRRKAVRTSESQRSVKWNLSVGRAPAARAKASNETTRSIQPSENAAFTAARSAQTNIHSSLRSIA